MTHVTPFNHFIAAAEAKDFRTLYTLHQFITIATVDTPKLVSTHSTLTQFKAKRAQTAVFIVAIFRVHATFSAQLIASFTAILERALVQTLATSIFVAIYTYRAL